MILGKRARASLCQLLLTLPFEVMTLLLDKYGIETDLLEKKVKHGLTESDCVLTIHSAIIRAAPLTIANLMQEITKTRNALRNQYFDKTNRSFFDERWEDLRRCLQLDGYDLARDGYGRELDQFAATEPIIEGAGGAEDDLTVELRRSSLSEAQEILRVLEGSAASFRGGDFNGCLTNARVALQALATAIANARRANHPGNFDETKWGQVADYLRKTDFINQNQEQGLTGVFSFLSGGAHIPIGFNDEEFARLGRGLAVSFCYFLIKTLNSCES